VTGCVAASDQAQAPAPLVRQDHEVRGEAVIARHDTDPRAIPQAAAPTRWWPMLRLVSIAARGDPF